MKLIEKIKEIMIEEYEHCGLLNTSTLTELAALSKCKPIVLTSKSQMLIYKVDQSLTHREGHIIDRFPFFKDGLAKKVADYLIFYQPNETKLFTFVCELKSDNSDGALNQLSATKILAEYIISTAKRCLNHQAAEKSSIKGLLFSNKPVYKKKEPL